MTQQTAVEWLINQINSSEWQDKYIWHKEEIFKEAKQIEKNQLHKVASFWRGKENEIEKPIFQQYYNETFKN